MAGGITLGMKALGIGGDDAAEQVARLLREGRAAEVTDEMLGALGPNDQAKLFDLYESGATGMNLPMDTMSRMNRAESMGFDMDKDFYHGSAVGGYNDSVDIKAVDPTKAGDRWNADKRGFAITDSQRDANFYAKPTDRPFGQETPDGAVYPLMDKSQKPLDLRVGPLDGPISAWDERPPDTYDVIDRGGYDSVRLAGDDTEMRVVMDPANIRSRHARFDPRLSKNADLLASRAAPGSGGVGTQEASSAPLGIMAIPMRPTSPTMPSGEGASLSDVLGRLKQAFGLAGKAGLEGYAQALTGQDEQGRSVGSILPFAKDERTGEVGLASPRILDLWNTAGGVVPAKGITLGAGPVVRRAAEALPMDQASRMARSKSLGFGGPVYHGTADDIRAFNGGTWVTGDPRVASDYSHRAAVRGIPEERLEGAINQYGDSYVDEWGETRLPDVDEMPQSEMNMLSHQYGEGQSVVPLMVRDKNVLDMTELGDAPSMEDLAEFLHSKGVIDDDALGDAQYWIDEIDVPSDEFGGDPTPTIWKAIEDLGLADDIRKAGYDGLSIEDVAAGGGYGHPATLIFDPKNIRSTHAAFDPAKRDSADLLASRAAPGSLGIGGDDRRLTFKDIEDQA